MSTMLLVVDVQNGFINEFTAEIPGRVIEVIEQARLQGLPTLFTRFVNTPDSGFVRWIGWHRLMHTPETAVVEEVQPYAETVITKHIYSAFTPEFERFLANNAINKIVLCGIATDSCILKTAVDSFERGIEPVVLTDVCASHGGPDCHNAGLLLLGRFIGKAQLKSWRELDRTRLF